MSEELELRLTLADCCQLMSERLGETITPESHWLESSIEMTRDAAPYVVVRLKANKR